jgi:hypothetical protein
MKSIDVNFDPPSISLYSPFKVHNNAIFADCKTICSMADRTKIVEEGLYTFKRHVTVQQDMKCKGSPGSLLVVGNVTKLMR